MRSFIAIEIPAPVRDMIEQQIQAFKALNLPIKWVKHENLHITLKFLGDIDEDIRKKLMLCLQEVGARQQVFSVTLRHFGCFPNVRRPRVLWIGLEKGAEHVMQLAQDIEESLQQCGFLREGRFHPHLTIGRTKRQCLVNGVLKNEFLSERFEVNSLVLFKSTLTPQGAFYDALGTFPFGKNSKPQ